MSELRFSELIGESIKRAYIVLWPPFGEEEFIGVSLSFLFELEGRCGYYLLSISSDDNWSIQLNKSNVGSVYSWDDFELRIKQWMNMEIEAEFTNEFYEITDIELFSDIIDKTIENVELLRMSGQDTAFGVKLIFDDDYLIACPNSDGTIIETKHFNKNKCLENFYKLGEVQFEPLKSGSNK